jgi:hypothetical protein
MSTAQSDTDWQLHQRFQENLSQLYGRILKLQRLCDKNPRLKEIDAMCESCKRTVHVYWNSNETTPITDLWTKLTNTIMPMYYLYHHDDSKVARLFEKIHRMLFHEVSRRGIATLRNYFESNAEMHRMGQQTYQSHKSVMALQPSSSMQGENEEGTTQWFAKIWNKTLPDDEVFFCACMGRMLHLTRPSDFCVSLRPFLPVPVIFYIHPILEQLARRTFRTRDDYTPFEQALNLLHDPHPEYRAFIAKAYDLYQEYLIDSRLRLTPTLDLSTLLDQLRAGQHDCAGWHRSATHIHHRIH